MVYWYYIDESISPFTIGYIINPSLNCNKVFIEPFEKCVSVSFHKNTMEHIRDCLKNNNACVMALIMVYNINWKKPNKSV